MPEPVREAPARSTAGEPPTSALPNGSAVRSSVGFKLAFAITVVVLSIGIVLLIRWALSVIL